MTLVDSRYRNEEGKVSRTLIALLLHKKRHDSPGWLRRIEATDDAPEGCDASKRRQQLFEVEKRKLLDLLLLCRPHDSSIMIVANAWGVAETFMHDIYFRLLEAPTTAVARKKRTDSSKTLQNSKEKRQSVHSPQLVFAPLRVTAQRVVRVRRMYEETFCNVCRLRYQRTFQFLSI